MDATDEMIRQRYLTLVKQHPPERDPERFHKITEAYEAIKDRRSRIQSRLFDTLRNVDTKNALDDLIATAKYTKKRVGLNLLVKSVGP